MSEGSFNPEITPNSENQAKTPTSASDKFMENVWEAQRSSAKIGVILGALPLPASAATILAGGEVPTGTVLSLGIFALGTGFLAFDSARRFAARKIEEIKTRSKK